MEDPLLLAARTKHLLCRCRTEKVHLPVSALISGISETPDGKLESDGETTKEG